MNIVHPEVRRILTALAQGCFIQWNLVRSDLPYLYSGDSRALEQIDPRILGVLVSAGYVTCMEYPTIVGTRMITTYHYIVSQKGIADSNRTVEELQAQSRVSARFYANPEDAVVVEPRRRRFDTFMENGLPLICSVSGIASLVVYQNLAFLLIQIAVIAILLVGAWIIRGLVRLFGKRPKRRPLWMAKYTLAIIIALSVVVGYQLAGSWILGFAIGVVFAFVFFRNIGAAEGR